MANWLVFWTLVHYLFGKGSPNYFYYYFFISFAIARSSSGALFPPSEGLQMGVWIFNVILRHFIVSLLLLCFWGRKVPLFHLIESVWGRGMFEELCNTESCLCVTHTSPNCCCVCIQHLSFQTVSKHFVNNVVISYCVTLSGTGERTLLLQKDETLPVHWSLLLLPHRWTVLIFV